MFGTPKEADEVRVETESRNPDQRWQIMPPLKPKNQIVARRSHCGVQRNLQLAQFDIALVASLQRGNEILARHRLKPYRQHRSHCNDNDECDSRRVQSYPEPSLPDTPRSAHISSIALARIGPIAANEQTDAADRY